MKNYQIVITILVKDENDEEVIRSAKEAAEAARRDLDHDAYGYQECPETREIKIVELDDAITPIRDVATINDGI